MRFRVVRAFDKVTDGTNNVAYRVETEGKMTQADALELARLLSKLTNVEYLRLLEAALDSTNRT